ncbi:MAG TPA: hypothetical protein VJ898_15765 [Natrialbaceae archaeon]|nr:hypothetical protein [Natrialbaceae archaeon]
MTEDSEDAGEDEPTEHGTERRTWERMTAPQQAYSARDIGIGVVVAAISLAITFGVPLAFTL